MNDSPISGFYRLDIRQRIDRLEQLGLLSADDATLLREGRHVLLPTAADGLLGVRFIERVLASSSGNGAWTAC